MFNKKEEKKIENSMIIDPIKGIYFADRDNADVIPMTCRNNNQDYRVFIVSDEEKPLELPDSGSYYDPGEYGNVLSLPAQKKLFEKRQGLLQQLAPWALVAIIAIIGVLTIMAMNPGD